LASERHVIVAGAGIGGLTAALALARAGFRTTVFEQAALLEETGAGIQLSPNASRVLIGLGLGSVLRRAAMAPEAVRIMSGASGNEIARIPLGLTAEHRYGAPYWTLHRADLQAALYAAAKAEQDIAIQLGARVEDFVVHENGITVQVRSGAQSIDERGIALIGADGLWSAMRARIKGLRKPRSAHRTAWRALVPAEAIPAPFREPVVHLWFGPDGHIVHYPVKNGTLVNIVAIVHDDWQGSGWSTIGAADEILRHFARFSWADTARALLAVPDRWLKWSLYEAGGAPRPGEGPVTLVGDAAHPMLPFIAQGAGMAIEDATVLAAALKRNQHDPVAGLRQYETQRRSRVLRVQRQAQRQGRLYGQSGPQAAIRNVGMRLLGGNRLLHRYDWLYKWQPPAL
jgi:salicylate hydroxylase